jgi:retinol dehydrogenase 12
MMNNLENKKTVAISGVTSGIGYYILKHLIANGYEVIIFARNTQKAHSIAKKFSEGKENFKVYYTDFLLPETIKSACEKCIAEHQKIDVLINNAGAVFSKYALNNNGIERTIAVNQIACYLITTGLLPALKNAENARIVNVASRAHYGVKYDVETVNKNKWFFFRKQYKISKLGNMLLTMKFVEILKPHNITVNALDPGFIKTPFGCKTESWWFRLSWFVLTSLFGDSAEKGAETPIYVAFSDELNGISGQYFEDCKPAPIAEEVFVRENIENCWEWTRRLS